jgi:hypothetical protein
MDPKSLIGKRISAVGILINISSNSIVQAFKEAGYKVSSSTKINVEHLLVLQDYIKKSKGLKKTAGLTEQSRVGIAKMCLKLGLRGKTLEQTAIALNICEDQLLTTLQIKAPAINLLTIITDNELLLIREYLEKDAAAKRLQQRAKIKAIRKEQLKANPPSKRKFKKINKQEEPPKLKIIYTPHPKY